MHVLVMRNNRINWGYHVFYVSNSSSFRYNLEGKPATSFTKNSVLTIGGNQSEEKKSFPGDFGPLFFSHIDIYDKLDANAYISMFHSGASTVNNRFVPSEI